MERWHRAFTKNDTEFKQLFGVKKETFHEMLAVLTVAYEERRRKGGPRPKLTALDDVLVFLKIPVFLQVQTIFDLHVVKGKTGSGYPVYSS